MVKGKCCVNGRNNGKQLVTRCTYNDGYLYSIESKAWILITYWFDR